MDLPVVGDSYDDEMVSHEREQMRSILEEAILETRSMPLENRPRLPRIPLSKRNRAVVRALNPMLVTYFGAAVAACRIIGAKLPMAGRATKQSSAIPAWRKRIEDRITKARALIGRLTTIRSGNNRPRVVRTVRMAFAGTNISLSQPDITQKLTERIDYLKQKIAAWGKRLRRFTERSRRFNQNRLFQSDLKRLYKSLERPEVCGAGPGPDQANTVAFWRGLWSEPVNHSEGPWTEVVASQCASITPMDPVIITPDDVAEAVRRAPNWKSPGLDGLHHYWLKGFMMSSYQLWRAKKMNNLLNENNAENTCQNLSPEKSPNNELLLSDVENVEFEYLNIDLSDALELRTLPENCQIVPITKATEEPIVIEMTEPTLLETINYSSITPSTSVTSHNNIDKEINNDRVSISPNLSFAESNVLGVQDLSHEIGSQNMDLHETYVQDGANNMEDGSDHEGLVPYDIHSDSMSDSDY
ncbi:unnamed protein product [Parnassius apollo]|uniref:(apollo) hypothetical protein n=1 Tax=Parnassius apollo TaxID=110799 RepID=A0A8S3XEZ8_PARAO|nr:unnamed protein product [Parnassius apollo]